MEELDYCRNLIGDATWQKLRPSHNEVSAFIYNMYWYWWFGQWFMHLRLDCLLLNKKKRKKEKKRKEKKD